MAREINLVPDIKGEMIKALKLRNYVFYICILGSAIALGLVLIFGLIAGGQRYILKEKDATLSSLSEKLNSYSDLGDFLTIKDQLSGVAALTSNKTVLSRTFNVLSALLPVGADTITISELNVDLTAEQPTLSFDAQANAGREPFIDYNVLDSFKKSMQYMRYDYGNYVDKKGQKIPAYCMIETGQDGAILNDSDRGLYAFWTINAEGCNPSSDVKVSSYSLENYDGKDVVRIWRTPQFDNWYKEKPVEGQPSMTLEGKISGVEHFESACVSYVGNASANSASPKWTDSNNCLLVPDGSEGIKVSDSSNGRDSSNELVLRFSATISLSPEVYKFTNSHMLAIAPTGRRNVTDSYVQIQAMFSERAKDCAKGDTDCNSNVDNLNGGN